MMRRGFVLPYLTCSPLGGRLLISVLVLLAVLVPALNLAVSPDSMLHVPTYVVALAGKYLCFALLAISVDLI